MANQYDIVFYQTERGEMPVLDFLYSLSEKEQAKCSDYLTALAERGNTLPSNFVKRVEHGLWELRPEYGGTEFRFFYFTVIENTIIMLHAIKKKTQRIPRKDIELALKRKKEF